MAHGYENLPVEVPPNENGGLLGSVLKKEGRVAACPRAINCISCPTFDDEQRMLLQTDFNRP